MELDLGEPEPLAIPVVEFTGGVVGGEALAGEETPNSVASFRPEPSQERTDFSESR